MKQTNEIMFKSIFYLNKSAAVLEFMIEQRVSNPHTGVSFWYSDADNREKLLEHFDIVDPSFREHLKKILAGGFLVKIARGCYMIDQRTLNLFEAMKEAIK